MFISAVLPFTILLAQAEPPSEPPPTMPPPVSAVSAPAASAVVTEPRWYDKIAMDGLGDASFTYRAFGDFRQQTQFRPYDQQAGTFSLNYARLGVGAKFRLVALRVDLGFGPVADLTTFEPALVATTVGGLTTYAQPPQGTGQDVFRNLVQGYISFFAPVGGRTLQIDVGRFYTSVGTEVINTNENWNYSRSMAFYYGPYTHTGLRMQLNVTDELTLQGSLINGWDSVLDINGAPGGNVGATYTHKNTTLALQYYVSVENPGAVKPARHLVDLLWVQKFGENFALNFDTMIGYQEALDSAGAGFWGGASLQARYLVAKYFRISGRFEYFGDPDGVRTGVATHWFNTTLTAGIPFLDHAELRFEGRVDAAKDLVFVATNDEARSYQATLTAAALFWF